MFQIVQEIPPRKHKDTKIIHHCVPGHSPSMRLYNFATFNFMNFFCAGISSKTLAALAESTFQETPELVRGLGSLSRACIDDNWFSGVLSSRSPILNNEHGTWKFEVRSKFFHYSHFLLIRKDARIVQCSVFRVLWVSRSLRKPSQLLLNLHFRSCTKKSPS